MPEILFSFRFIIDFVKQKIIDAFTIRSHLQRNIPNRCDKIEYIKEI